LKIFGENLNSVGQRWTTLDSVEKSWIALDIFGKNLNSVGQHWTALDIIGKR
jgi:hypothetical protein